MFNLFFCILQKPTSEAIVTAAKIFRKEPLTDYHRSLNEEAARLAENDPSLLTNRGKLLQKAREALLARGKYQLKKGRSRSKILDNNSAERESRPKRVKIDKETRKAQITEIEESIKDIDDEISFKEKRRSQAATVHDYRQCDEISERLSSVKEKRRLLQHELSLLRKKDMKAKWYKKSKIRKQPSTLSDTSDAWSSSTQSAVDLSQSSQNNSTSPDVIDLSASNVDQEIEEQNELSESLPSTEEVEESSSEDDDQGFQGGLLLRKRSLHRSGVTGGQ